MVGCLDFLRVFCCGLRADCCEVRLRGKTERDCERGCCSSRRYGAPTPNRVGNGVLTRPHAPFEDRRVRSVSATHQRVSHALPRAREGVTHAGNSRHVPPRARGEAATRFTRCHAPTAHALARAAHAPGGCWYTHATRGEGKPRAKEAPAVRHVSADQPYQSESQALVSEGSRERGRGQGRGHHRGTEKGRWRSQVRGRTVRCFYCDQEGHIKRDCPKYKAQVQSSDTAATAVMADDDEIDVLLVASDNGKSDWGELLSDMGPVVLARRMDKGSNRCTEKSGQTRVVQPVQVVHREAQRKETKSILRSCTAKGAATPKRVSFALDLISGGVLSSCAHKGGEMEPRQLAK
ncbi:hypothetical protein Acr_27g0005950 [Actinidia rufa]|uniref:CCHC-type domain-containing protein n=1 Tax=Actinidia rufa TaxID=165716 RepID=A0A7J0H6Z2_9ERIC|nr:hypothetical protein Acr_27g0005950 [Actinidia rufa]